MATFWTGKYKLSKRRWGRSVFNYYILPRSEQISKPIEREVSTSEFATVNREGYIIYLLSRWHMLGEFNFGEIPFPNSFYQAIFAYVDFLGIRGRWAVPTSSGTRWWRTVAIGDLKKDQNDSK